MEGRLIVENFGPIKKVDIQLNKLMVLIGPQSGGKSTIAKLLAVINETFSYYGDHHFRRMRAGSPRRHFKEGLNKYNINWDTENAAIHYTSSTLNFSLSKGELHHEYVGSIKRTRDKKDLFFFEELLFELDYLVERFERRFLSRKETYDDNSADYFEILSLDLLRTLEELVFLTKRLMKRPLQENDSPVQVRFFNKTSEVNAKADKYFKLLTDKTENSRKSVSKEFVVEVNGFIKTSLSFYRNFLAEVDLVYVPAERIFTAMASGAFYSLQRSDIPLPECIIDFGANFETSRNEISSFQVKELGVTYRYENGNDLLELENKDTIKLKEGSSGYQTMIPMALVLEYFSKKKNQAESTKNIFIVEEPELNLYPITQKQLVDFLAERCVNDRNSLLVTTHSPYILSAFANLIKANEVAKLSDEKKAKIKKVVPERYWIDYNDTSAYLIDKGVSKNIMDKKFKTIDFSQIDKASDVIGGVFDKLLTIEIED